MWWIVYICNFIYTCTACVSAYQRMLRSTLPPHLPPHPPLPAPPLPLLKHPHGINQPIRLHKRARILLHIRLARPRLLLTAALRPVLPRPRPAKRRVENEIHILEVRIDVAVAGVVREGGAPGARVRGAGRDIGGDVLPREEPDGDGGGGPGGRVDAAADGVEVGAEGLGVGGEDAAAGVFGLGGGVGVAVCGVGGAGHGGVFDGAAGGGVEGHGVGGGAVDAFDYVDFAHCGPVGSDEPESGPDAADAAGHVGDVGEEEAFVVGFFAGDADALAAGVGCGVVVDAHVGGVAVVADGSDHFVLHCGGVVDILHEAGRGVGLGEGRKGVEEVVALVGIGEDIAGYAHAEDGGKGEEAGEAVGIHF